MASSIQDVWSSVRAEYKEKLTLEDWSTINSVGGVEDVASELSHRNEAYGKRKLPKWSKRFGDAINYIRPLMSVIDTFVQSDPTVSALVWGSIKAVLEVSQEQPLRRGYGHLFSIPFYSYL